MGDRRVALILLIVLSFVLVSLPQIGVVKADSTIYIRADGSIAPSTASIQRDGNVYTFKENISISEFSNGPYGIVVERGNIVVDGSGYTLQGTGSGWGIYISTKINVIIKNINIKYFNHGIYLNQSWNITIERNTVSTCFWGIHIVDSNENTVTGNTLTNNSIGIKFEQSSTNMLRNNHMSNNTYNFWIQFGGYVNDVDVSNTVDGKPIYYWVAHHDKIVPSDAGYVALVNCTSITVQNMNLINNGQGILLAYTKNSRIVKNTVANNMFGIELFHSSNNTIDGNDITNHNRGIWLDDSSNNNIISGNYMTKNERAISEGYQEPSINNIVSGNNITANTNGILLFSNNTISGNSIRANANTGIEPVGGSCTIIGNNVTNNRVGIYITSSNNILRNNRMDNNGNNFYVKGGPANDVDNSNLVNGKPIYYWVNERDKTVPSNAGYVALVNCKNITVQNLNLANNWEAIRLSSTTNSIITKNIITNVSIAITFYNSSDNHIIGNNITNNEVGIYFSGSTYPFTIYFPSPNNSIYHNNFANNQKHIDDIIRSYPNDLTPAVNLWDNGYEGNYWSDYIGSDANLDGIGDTPHVIDADNQDRYPLLAPIKSFDAGMWEWTNFNVDVISNSTVSNFSFNPEEGALIRFDVEGESGTTGFCRVTIPKDLLNAEGNWVVLVDGYSVTPTVKEDTSDSYIYFTYPHSTKTVEIIGTDVIPEFPSWIILPLLLVATLVAIIYKRRLFSVD